MTDFSNILSWADVWAPTLLLVAARVGGIFLISPVFSHAAVPARLRVAMSLVIALAAVGRMASPVTLAGGWLPLAGWAVLELLIGFVIGYAARLVLTGVELGAGYVGQQIGVSLGAVFDPNGTAGSDAVRTLLKLMAIVIFLAIGGHRAVIAATLGTFHSVPPAVTSNAMLNTVAALLMTSFALALQVAAPVLVTLLLVTAAIGLIQRSMPSMHILSVGMPIRVVVGLIALAGTLAVLLLLLDCAWAKMLEQLLTWVGGG